MSALSNREKNMGLNKRSSDSEKSAWDAGGSAYEITKADGKRYRVTKDGLIPITGTEAQNVLKRQRKRRKPAAGG
jgi:hypothetical protein